MARVVKDWYKVLGVEPSASKEEIKKAYRRLSRSLHPDVNSAEDAQEKFDEIKQAYDLLTNDEERAIYDEFVQKNAAPQAVFDFDFQNMDKKKKTVLRFALLFVNHMWH